MIDLGQGVQLISRSEAKLRAPRSRTSVNPTFGSTAHWEGPHMGWPWDHAACFSLVRGIQNFHMDTRGWQDIAYTGIVCPHGYVFEGRWVGHRTAANGTNDGNNRALALCYLGGQRDKFTDAGKRAMRAAMDYLDGRGAGPGRNGHRDWKPTECPGEDIYVWVHAGQKVPGGTTPKQEDDFMAALTDKQQLEMYKQLTQDDDDDPTVAARVRKLGRDLKPDLAEVLKQVTADGDTDPTVAARVRKVGRDLDTRMDRIEKQLAELKALLTSGAE